MIVLKEKELEVDIPILPVGYMKLKELTFCRLSLRF